MDIKATWIPTGQADTQIVCECCHKTKSMNDYVKEFGLKQESFFKYIVNEEPWAECLCRLCLLTATARITPDGPVKIEIEHRDTKFDVMLFDDLTDGQV